MEIGKFFKIVRLSKNLGQLELADLAGVSKSALSQFESGQASVSKDTLLKICSKLDINREFIGEKSINPFFSQRLIKFVFPELSPNIIDRISDVTLIEMIVESNQIAEFIFLSVPQFKVIQKISDITKTDIPPYALLCRDEDNNIFLFRRKRSFDYITNFKDIQRKFKRVTDEDKKQIIVKSKKIGIELYEKIKNWTVEKEDVEDIFEDELIILTVAEKKLIRTIRDKNINPNIVLRKLKF